MVVGGGITAGILLTGNSGDKRAEGGQAAPTSAGQSAPPSAGQHASSCSGSSRNSPPSSAGEATFGQPTPEKLRQAVIDMYRCGNAQLLSQIVCGRPSQQDIQQIQQSLGTLPKDATYSAVANSPETESVHATGTITLEADSKSAGLRMTGPWPIMQVGTNWCVES